MKTLNVRADDAIVCSDFHVPMQSEPFINKMIMYVRANGHPDTLIVAGDFWNFDKLSDFEVKDKYTLDEEFSSGKVLIDRLLSNFARIFMVKGNHEERLPRAMGNYIGYAEMMKHLHPKIVVVEMDHLILRSGKKEIKIAHQKMYSSIKGKIVSMLAHFGQQHLMIGHSHNAYISTDHTSRHIAVDLGCMCDPNKVIYKQMRTNTYPAWDNAFAHVKNGRVRLITKETF